MLNRRPPHASLRGADPFSAEPRWRRLSLIVDGSRPSHALTFLAAYGSTPTADALLVSDTAAARVTLHDAKLDEPRDYFPVEVVDARGGYITSVASARWLIGTADEVALENNRDRNQVIRLLVLSHLARTSPAIDALVSDDPLVRAAPEHFIGAHSSAEGVALLGLALRAKGDFTIERFTNTTTYIEDERFYRGASFQLVGDVLEPWLRSAAGAWSRGRVRPFELVQGVVARLARALRARDYVHVRERSADFETAWAEDLFFFDVLLVALSGALDTTARLMYELYDLSTAHKRRSWSDRRFVDALRGVLEFNVDTVATTARLIGLLRNRVHEGPFTEEMRMTSGRVGWMDFGEGALAIPRSDEAIRMRELAERAGGMSRWGLSDRPELGVLLVSPGVYTERAVRAVAAAITMILQHADRARLGTEAHLPVQVEGGDLPAQHRQNAFILAGLGSEGLRVHRAVA